MEVRPVGKGTLRLAGTILADCFGITPRSFTSSRPSHAGTGYPPLPDGGLHRRAVFRLGLRCVPKGELVGVSAWLPPGAYPASTAARWRRSPGAADHGRGP